MVGNAAPVLQRASAPAATSKTQVLGHFAFSEEIAMDYNTHSPREDLARPGQASAPGAEKAEQAGNADKAGKEAAAAAPAPESGKPALRHDLTGEFDCGVEGGQTQDHGQDRTEGT
jgi:hypothetical protein